MGDLIAMKFRVLSIIVVSILLFSAINVIGINLEEENTIEIKEESYQISFSEATVDVKDNYASVSVIEANTLLRDTGKPMLPAYTKTFTFPRGTIIKDVECIISDVSTEIIDYKIQPAAKPLPRISLSNTIEQIDDAEDVTITIDQSEDEEVAVEDFNVYSSSELYPEKWYDYNIYCGLNKGEDTLFLKFDVYPTRYSPAEDTLYSINSVDFKITYEEPSTHPSYADEYDLLIIAPEKFRIMLLPLYFHKVRYGISTKIQSVEEIYQEYEGIGRDKPEQIKYFIKDAKEEWNVKYVLLVGGLNSHWYADDKDNLNEGSAAWYVPVRYGNIHTEPESGYITDLYYSDIYKYNKSSAQYEFDDWDSDGDGIYLDYGDIVDLYPDVYLSRLPCRNVIEVRKLVKKIIDYEKPSLLGKPWMNKMIVAGGRTFEIYEGQPDGEWLCDLSLDYMGNNITRTVKLYSSNYYTGKKSPEGNLAINVNDEEIQNTNEMIDDSAISSDWRTPSTPIIKGPTNVKIDEYYNYSFQSKDPNRDKVSYYILWGDGNSTITPYYPSGLKISLSKNWSCVGDYTIRVWATDNSGDPCPTAADIIVEYTKGAGYVLLQGHGSPVIWDTHWVDCSIYDPCSWVGGFTNYHMTGLLNGKRLPVVVVGGCHNAMFNVTLLKTFIDNGTSYFTYHVPAAECFSWKLVSKLYGGAIASTGCTDFGIGWPGYPLNLNAELESDFFYEIGRNNATHFGDAHSGSIIKYLTDNNIEENQYESHVYAITEYQAFGDPSLKFGGY